MCRIFGFRSVLFSQVHSSLISADNALMNQSQKHPDGWGVAFYVHETPHIIRSLKSALSDSLFKKVSGVVSSQTVIAHIRNATKGQVNILNTHPFQYGKWVFAHNGNIRDFSKHKDKLMALIDPQFTRYILGETDSEYIFYILLTEIIKKTSLEESNLPIEEYFECIEVALQNICNIIGELKNEDRGFPTQNYLTFTMSNGRHMFGMQAGQPLNYSTHKKLCPERDTCAHFNLSCENQKNSGPVNHLILSSEILQGENIWTSLNPGEIVAVDEKMQIHKQQFSLPFIAENSKS